MLRHLVSTFRNTAPKRKKEEKNVIPMEQVPLILIKLKLNDKSGLFGKHFGGANRTIDVHKNQEKVEEEGAGERRKKR